MATLTHIYHPPRVLRLACAKKLEETLEAWLPRRCMVVSVGLILVGLSLPFWMALGWLPVNLWLGCLGFALTFAGGMLTLNWCGEI